MREKGERRGVRTDEERRVPLRPPDADLPARDLGVLQLVFRSPCLVVAGHLDEAVTQVAPGLLVPLDVDRQHLGHVGIRLHGLSPRPRWAVIRGWGNVRAGR